MKNILEYILGVVAMLVFVGLLAWGLQSCIGRIDDQHKKEKKMRFDERCQPLAEAARDLSEMRDDGFVVDSIGLHAFSKSNLPMWLWSKRLIEEANLRESENYVIADHDGQKRPLLTIEAVWEIAVNNMSPMILDSFEARELFTHESVI